MERISFNDVCNAIRASLLDGNYDPKVIAKWDSVYNDGSFAENWLGYVDTVGSLCSFLRSVVGIANETEESVVLYAITIAFEEPSIKLID